MVKTFKFALILAFLITSTVIFPQIKIINRNSENSNFINYISNSISETRVIKPLTNWNVYNQDEPNKKITTPITDNVEGSEILVFETNLDLTINEIEEKNIKLCVNGLNYAVEIFINKFSLFKRTGGEIPFEVDIPKDILNDNSNNKLSIKLNPKLDSKSTIPVQQRFLFAKENLGIVRDIYLELSPITSIDNLNLDYNLGSNLSSADINFSFTIQNLTNLIKELSGKESVRIKVNITHKDLTDKVYNQDFIINDDKNDLVKKFNFSLSNPILWSPSSPHIYNLSLELYKGTQLIDKIVREISFYSLESGPNGLRLNNAEFSFKGTTYYLNENLVLSKSSFEKIKGDLTLIKNTGFNAVRFAKHYPNPIAVKLCEELGLFSLVELPINSVPEKILSNNEFKLRAALRFKELIKKYDEHSNTVLYGLGSSYLSNSNLTIDFLTELIQGTSKDNLYYASFIGLPENSITGIDLYGIEIYSGKIEEFDQLLKSQNILLDSQKIFISEISYPNYFGSSSGYLVKNSSEAQAKYFENIFKISQTNKINSFFINTFYNYSGDYNSLYAGSGINNLYKLGILQGTPNLNSITYKVIKSKLTNGEKVTIPIGNAKDENKLLFILLALGLSVIMALLINSKKKFREDCTRALFRPYNFFADIRDHRILPSIHTFILFLIEVGSISLFFTIILFYLRTNLFIEKLLLSFGEPEIISSFSYLAWNPEKGFIYLFIIILVKIFLVALIIKFASFFIKTNVNISSIFYMLVWSLLPFTILLPVELIFYKILSSGQLNSFVIVFLILFFFWIFFRILKGIHVVFDTRPLPVYIYGIVFVFISGASVLLYYHLTHSTFFYILNAIKQYQLMSF